MNSLIVLNKNDNVGVSQFIMPEKTKINDKTPIGERGRNLINELKTGLI